MIVVTLREPALRMICEEDPAIWRRQGTRKKVRLRNSAGGVYQTPGTNIVLLKVAEDKEVAEFQAALEAAQRARTARLERVAGIPDAALRGKKH